MARGTKLTASVIALGLVGAVGIAGFAQPLKGAQQLRAATIRIVLPSSGRPGPAAPITADGTLRFLLPKARPYVPATARIPRPAEETALAQMSADRRPSPTVALDPAPTPGVQSLVTAAPLLDSPTFAPSIVAPPLAIEAPRRLVQPMPAIAEAAPRRGSGRYRRTVHGLAFEVPAVVSRGGSGTVSLLIRDGRNISVGLADLLTILEPAVAPPVIERLRAAQGAQSHVTLNDLRAAGIRVRFDDDDRLILGRR